PLAEPSDRRPQSRLSAHIGLVASARDEGEYLPSLLGGIDRHASPADTNLSPVVFTAHGVHRIDFLPVRRARTSSQCAPQQFSSGALSATAAVLFSSRARNGQPARCILGRGRRRAHDL